MGLYSNGDSIGYKATQVDLESPETYSSMVFSEAPTYLIEHEFRVNPDKTLEEIVEGELSE